MCLALDSAIVGFTTALMTVVAGHPTCRVGGAAILLGAFAAAGYAVAVATRPAVRAEPRGSDALFLGGVLVLCLNAAGEAAREIGLGLPGRAGRARGGAVRHPRPGPLGLDAGRASRQPTEDRRISSETRLSLVPAVAAAGAIVRPVVGSRSRAAARARLLRHHHARSG